LQGETDVDIDATIAAVDNMRKNFDTVPREEAIIKAGYVYWRKVLMKAKAEYSGVSWEYHSLTSFLEYPLSLAYPVSRQRTTTNGLLISE
jgi:hypothetical protein